MRAAIVVALGATVGAADDKPDALTMTLSAHVSPAQSDVIVRARVERDVRSRELTIVWVSDDLSGGLHAIPLEGARAPVAHQYALKRLDPGQYVVTTILRLSDGDEVRRTSRLVVTGHGSDPFHTTKSGSATTGRGRRAGR